MKDIEETGKRQRIPARTVAQMLDTSTLENLASTISQDTESHDNDDLRSELERLKAKLAEVIRKKSETTQKSSLLRPVICDALI